MKRERTLEENVDLMACDTQEILRELRTARFRKEEKREARDLWIKVAGLTVLILLASIGLSTLLVALKNIF